MICVTPYHRRPTFYINQKPDNSSNQTQERGGHRASSADTTARCTVGGVIDVDQKGVHLAFACNILRVLLPLLFCLLLLLLWFRVYKIACSVKISCRSNVTSPGVKKKLLVKVRQNGNGKKFGCLGSPPGEGEGLGTKPLPVRRRLSAHGTTCGEDGMDAARLLLLLSSHFGCRYDSALPHPVCKIAGWKGMPSLHNNQTAGEVSVHCSTSNSTKRRRVYASLCKGRTEGKITRYDTLRHTTHDRKAHGRVFYLSSFLRRRNSSARRGKGGAVKDGGGQTNNLVVVVRSLDQRCGP